MAREKMTPQERESRVEHRRLAQVKSGPVIRAALDRAQSQDRVTIECASRRPDGETVFFCRNVVAGPSGRGKILRPEWATVHATGRVSIPAKRTRVAAYEEFLAMHYRESGVFVDWKDAAVAWAITTPQVAWR